MSTCPQTLESRNMELHESFRKFTAAFVKLETYLTALAAVSTQSCDHPQANHRTFFEKLCECCQSISDVIKGEIREKCPSENLLNSSLPWKSSLVTISLNIWRHTSRLVNNARDLPRDRRVYSPLTPVISHRDTPSNSIADVTAVTVWASICHCTFIKWYHCIQWNHVI